MTSTQRLLGLSAVVTVVSTLFVVLAFSPVPHTGGDNSGYVSLAHGLLDGRGYTDVFDPAGLPHTKYPPLFPMLLAMMIAAGARTWTALKLSAAVPTIAAALFSLWWARKRVGELPALGAALLVGASSGFVYYSHWVLSDPLFVACTLGALFAFGQSTGDDERRWLTLGLVLAGLAYFTRSAGLPLVVAALGWLALRRRWRALAAAGAGLGLPMLAWALRARGEGVAQYGTEFWMVDPYQPELGRIGVGGLFSRAFENGSAYLTQHVPAGVVGADGPALGLIGALLTLAALVGWALHAREEQGVAEIFFPMYIGLILLWPAVWGGDRFALPLFPLLFVYGIAAIQRLEGRVPFGALRAAGAVAFLTLFLPAAATTFETREQTRLCAAHAAENGPWSCYGPRFESFVQAAAWSGVALPEGAAVLSRKPRHFYVHGGVPSRAFAFTEDPAQHLALADELGARYVLLDQWDGLAGRYVGGAVQRHPTAFCYMRAFGDPAQGASQLLGILPPESRDGGGADAAGGIEPCPASYYGVDTAAENYSFSSGIPLLEGLDS